MKWSLFIVLVILEFMVFGEDQETFSMETFVNRNPKNKLKNRDADTNKVTSALSAAGAELVMSNITCGLRPRSMLQRSLDSFQEYDDDYSEMYGEDKILGGQFASLGEVPWQVNIKILIRDRGRSKYKPECSGAIINEFWILTAAQCFQHVSPISFRVAVGDHHVTRADQGEQEFAVSKIIIHEQYKPSSFDYDIALIKIQPAANGAGIKFNSFVQPVCLPELTDFPGIGTDLMVSGWGRDSLSGASSPPILKKTLLPLVAEVECSKLFKVKITPRMFCAGRVNGPSDICRGDSGAPAVYVFADVKNVRRFLKIFFGVIPFLWHISLYLARSLLQFLMNNMKQIDESSQMKYKINR